LLANDGLRLAEIIGNSTFENDVAAKLKHFNAQVAIHPQSSIALSQGLAAGGQQSIGSEADISVISVDRTLNAPPPAAGSMATDKAIRATNSLRIISKKCSTRCKLK
jgi:hypothetical protein